MTYGIGAALNGGSLAGFGQQQEKSAMGMMGNAASQETQREITNNQIEASNRSGNAQLGSTIGFAAGSMIGGPIGGAIGGVLGGLAGSLF